MYYLNRVGGSVKYTLSNLYYFLEDRTINMLHYLFYVYLIPTYEMVFVMSFFMVTNLISGIYKTYRMEGFDYISKRRIGDSLLKLILYVVGLIVIYVFQFHFGKNYINLIYVYALSVSIRELKSILENIEIVTNTKIWIYIKEHIKAIYSKHTKIDTDVREEIERNTDKKVEDEILKEIDEIENKIKDNKNE